MRYKLGEVAKIRYGKDHKKLDDGNIPVYGSGGIMRYVDTALYDKKSVLIPRKGSLGNLFFANKPFWTVDTLFYTEIDENILMPEFLFYKLKMFNLASMNVGSAVPSLTTAILNALELDIPSLEVQSQIVNILKAFDERISLNKQINHHLAEQISLIYNLAITTQKVTTKTIDEVTVKNEDIIAVSKINSNNYVSTTNMISDKSGINNNITLPSTQYVKAFHPKDILISNIRPYFKKIWYSNKSGGHSVDVLNFRANTAIISPEILWAYLYQDSFFDAVTKSAKGTKMPRGDKNAIMKFKISIPANSKELTTTIRPILSLIAENNRQNYNLENLKSSLLPKLLSGELSVNQATK
ncbi:restriction endonuclease subunit S [Streptococcus ovis]